MAAKSPITIASRFTGKRGRERLIETLCIQPCVAGDRTLASRLSSVGKLREFGSEAILTVQGEADNDLFFIIIAPYVGTGSNIIGKYAIAYISFSNKP